MFGEDCQLLLTEPNPKNKRYTKRFWLSKRRNTLLQNVFCSISRFFSIFCVLCSISKVACFDSSNNMYAVNYAIPLYLLLYFLKKVWDF